MSLSPGAQIGAFAVLGPLGVGGMGKVYRARDGRLKRDVAIKVLPALFAADPERVARFQREAEILATLTHQHIAAVYGLEERDGVRALVMELIEGPTLADRIARGRIALDEAVPIARQIVDALDYAHEHGVLHRDLKPANIKLTPDGDVKVLDFGLARHSDHTQPRTKPHCRTPQRPSARRSPVSARFSGPPPIWRPSRFEDGRSTSARTSGPLAARCTRC